MTRNAYSYRYDPAVPPFPDDKPLIVFDGYCVLCSRSARFIVRYDRARRFRFAAAQSPLGRALYLHYGLNPDELESSVLLDEGRIWLRAEGTLRIAAALGWPWRATAVLRVLPPQLANGLYDWVARHL